MFPHYLVVWNFWAKVIILVNWHFPEFILLDTFVSTFFCVVLVGEGAYDMNRIYLCRIMDCLLGAECIVVYVLKTCALISFGVYASKCISVTTLMVSSQGFMMAVQFYDWLCSEEVQHGQIRLSG